MRFEQAAERFTGTVRNTTGQTVRDVRVEIHLFLDTRRLPQPGRSRRRPSTTLGTASWDVLADCPFARASLVARSEVQPLNWMTGPQG